MQDFYHLKRDNNPLRDEAFTLACLGKLHPASSLDFNRCGSWLSELLDEILLKEPLGHQHEILITGLTESGIIPALLMYMESARKNLNTHLIYSTRRPMSGIAFNESHSHGPNHVLPLTDCSFNELWIVEDEITSGNTVFNLMVQLYSRLQIDCVRVFAFADFRNMEQKADFISKTAENNIRCTVHTLPFFREQIKAPVAATPLILNRNMKPVDAFVEEHLGELTDNWHLPEKRPALGVKSGRCFDPELWSLPFEFSRGTILTVGESVDMAACFALANSNISFQQISLSPWKVDNKSIFSRITFADKYYLYNHETLKDPVYLICDPIDKEIGMEVMETLKFHGISVKPFLPVTERALQHDLL